MILEDPRIHILLQLRKEMEDEIEKMQNRIAQIEEYMQALDATIGTSSFATADTALGKIPEQEPLIDTAPVELTGEERSISIRAKDKDMELATIEVSKDNLKVIPASHAVYDIKRGAFARFFVERILGSFQQEDRVNVENGLMEWEEAFDFEVIAEDGILKELVVRNYGDEARLTEIERTLRWALEKIYRAR
jgi:hypothetical protein